MNEDGFAPCPFCGGTAGLSLVGDSDEPGQENEVHVACDSCCCTGPAAILGCREEEEDGPIDLDAEATYLWNDRYRPVTVEEIADLAPQLEASLAELERTNPEVRAARDALDNATDTLRQQAEALKAGLTPKERELLERRFKKEEK